MTSADSLWYNNVRPSRRYQLLDSPNQIHKGDVFDPMATKDYNQIPISRELLSRLFHHITVQNTGYETPCWLRRPQYPNEYVQIRIDGVIYQCHRLMYALFNEPVRLEQECDHLCRMPGCINPAHIEGVTPRVNKMRGVSRSAMNAQKTQCPCGRPYDFIHPSSGQRGCNHCRSEAARRAWKQRPSWDDCRHLMPTHCEQGHEFTKENSRILPSGKFQCKKCLRAKERAVYHERKNMKCI